ncbi:MAG: ABC transporter permease [Nitrospiraceae bacterium]|nr:ABC transporter permease [Nitrospiraceae bacterium]MDA8209200.1 ABC transporter permease [Actinomycetota bacterium]
MDRIVLIALREIRQRTASRGFRIATAVTMVAAIAYVVLPHVLASRNSVKTVATTSPVTAVERHTLTSAATAVGLRIDFRTYPTLEAAKAAVTSGAAIAAYDQSQGFFVKRIAAQDQATLFAQSAAQELGSALALQAAGLNSSQLQLITHPNAPPVVGLTPTGKASSSNTKAAAIAAVLMYILLSQYGAWVMLGIIEEKSSRVIEVLLSAVTPRELLVGKIAGIGAVAVIHATALVAAMTAGLYVIGSSPSANLSGGVLWLAPLWFILGYAFYCTLFAAVGSTVSRTEDAQAASFPVALPMLAGYIIALFGLGGSFPDPLLKALALVPGLSPFLVPAMYAVGKVSGAEAMASALISVAATYSLALVAARIYRASILRIGSRVSWQEAVSGALRRGRAPHGRAA